MRTAAMLVIGNEVLSGKVEEQNVAVAARALFDLGVALRRVVLCIDDIPTIARDVRALAAQHDIVLTSGGIGPTHDDVTIDAVAKAFEVPLDREPALEAAIRGHFGERCTEHHLRMANVPRGAELVGAAEKRWPTIKMENVYILPGVPSIFVERMQTLSELLDRGERFHRVELYLEGDEGVIAERFERVQRTFPQVDLGCYLAPKGADHALRLTFDGRNRDDVEAAASAFQAALAETERFIRRVAR